MKKIKIIYAGVVEGDFNNMEVENDLKVFQNLVGGQIEVITLTTDLAIIVNEAGRLLRMPDNENAPAPFAYTLKGNFLIVGVNGDDFTDWNSGKDSETFVDNLL